MFMAMIPVRPMGQKSSNNEGKKGSNQTNDNAQV